MRRLRWFLLGWLFFLSGCVQIQSAEWYPIGPWTEKVRAHNDIQVMLVKEWKL